MHCPSLQAWTVYKGRRDSKPESGQSVPLDQETLQFAVSTTQVSADFRYHCFKVFSFLSCYLRLIHQLQLLTRIKVHGKMYKLLYFDLITAFT